MVFVAPTGMAITNCGWMISWYTAAAGGMDTGKLSHLLWTLSVLDRRCLQRNRPRSPRGSPCERRQTLDMERLDVHHTLPVMRPRCSPLNNLRHCRRVNESS